MRPRIRLERGDCLAVMRKMPAETFDACVTDPPAGISFMGKAWDGDRGGRDLWIAWMQEVAAEALRVCKPGAHALVWALPRTSHWTATAWENAGWTVRDRVAHLFGTGMPKSLNVSKAIDRSAGAERKVIGPGTWHNSKRCAMAHGDTKRLAGGVPDITAPATPEAATWSGWGTGLKPACEDWWLLRAPLSETTVAANVLRHGTGALNIDACRVGTESTRRPTGASPLNPASGWNNNSMGNIIGGSDSGRFPANVTHSGDAEVEAAFAEQSARMGMHSAGAARDKLVTTDYNATSYNRSGTTNMRRLGDTGTASRFFYSAKASRADRVGSKHPTVKSISLMRYLCKLITPPSGTIIDPFAGSGATLQAAAECGFNAVGIEIAPEYQDDIRRRIAIMKAA